jgi:large subunit ribosomal protein L26e
MKFSSSVSSSARKQRYSHFNAPSHIRRKLMSAHLSKELKQKHSVRAMPIRKGDEVTVVRGGSKGANGKVITVYRKRFCIHIER